MPDGNFPKFFSFPKNVRKRGQNIRAGNRAKIVTSGNWGKLALHVPTPGFCIRNSQKYFSRFETISKFRRIYGNL